MNGKIMIILKVIKIEWLQSDLYKYINKIYIYT